VRAEGLGPPAAGVMLVHEDAVPARGRGRRGEVDDDERHRGRIPSKQSDSYPAPADGVRLVAVTPSACRGVVTHPAAVGCTGVSRARATLCAGIVLSSNNAVTPIANPRGQDDLGGRPKARRRAPRKLPRGETPRRSAHGVALKNREDPGSGRARKHACATRPAPRLELMHIARVSALVDCRGDIGGPSRLPSVAPACGPRTSESWPSQRGRSYRPSFARPHRGQHGRGSAPGRTVSRG
jgi:hypothetical protein